MSRRVAILGTGFSGLSLAWLLKNVGFEIEMFEKADRPGGLIQTHRTPVLVEEAAHAFLASEEVEKLFHELEVPMSLAGHRAKAKWIFRGRPRKWALGFGASLKAIAPLVYAKAKNHHWPRANETVSAWVQRLSSQELDDYLASPALQGVYGSSSEQLSASLILGGVFSQELRPRRGRFDGSIAPFAGMAEIINKLSQKLQEQGVKIHYQRFESIEQLKTDFDAVIVATSIKNASEILQASAPVFSKEISKIPRLSLTTVTVAYHKPKSELKARIQGFGCLFPMKEKFSSRGVLFNTDLFENRGPLETETWIFNDSLDQASDEEVIEKIKNDRRRLCSDQNSNFDFYQVKRWPQTLPLYGLELESFLNGPHFQLHSQKMKMRPLQAFYEGARLKEISVPLYLTGNYLGAIGLTKILSYNQRLARRIQAEIPEKAQQ